MRAAGGHAAVGEEGGSASGAEPLTRRHLRLREGLARFRFGLAAVALAGCADGDIRGRSIPSRDGHTYLIIADDNGGHCGSLRVDGKVWPHPADSAGRVTPGEHTIACGSDDSGFTVRVDSAQTYRFDYWGP